MSAKEGKTAVKEEEVEDSKPAAKETKDATAGSKRPASSNANDGSAAKKPAVPALQQQIQEQLQAQLQAQLSAAAARGQQAHITPAQIQAQAQAMVQAAAQAQAVVAAAKSRGNWTPMNASQIATLSHIQAQAIVHARGKRNTEGGADDQQIQTQIQLQTQALVHAHTQAQIQAGIYKGKDDSSSSAPDPLKASILNPPSSTNTTNDWMEGVTTEDNTPTMTEAQFKESLGNSLTMFWRDALQQSHNLQQQTEHDFKNHNDLPLARIKRIMKSDEDVRMISAEAPVLLAKACEWFILDVSIRAFAYSQLHKRRTLQKEDVKEAIQKTDVFDFLVDVIQ